MTILDLRKRVREILETQLLLMWERKLDRLERGFVSALRAFFTRQGREIIKAYKRDGKIVYDAKRWQKELTEIITEHHTKAVRYGHQRLRAEFENGIVKGWERKSVQWDGILENVAIYAADILGHLIVGIDETTRRRVAKTIREGILDGYSVNDIAVQLSELFDSFKGARSRLIARTETSRAANFGYIQTAKQLGFKRKRWLTALDEHVCPICGVMNGKVVSMDGTFTVTIDQGSKSAIYTAEQPPVHPACRCTTIVIDYPTIVNPNNKPQKPNTVESPERVSFNRENIARVLREHNFNDNLDDNKNPLRRVWDKWKSGLQKHVREDLKNGLSNVLLAEELEAMKILLSKIDSGFSEPLWRGTAVPATQSGKVHFINGLQRGDRVMLDMRGWSTDPEIAKSFASVATTRALIGVVWHLIHPTVNRAYPLDMLFANTRFAEEKEVLVLADKYTVIGKTLLGYGHDSFGNKYPIYQIDLVPEAEEGEYL